MKYRLPTTHQQEADQADARFIRCENDIRLTNAELQEARKQLSGYAEVLQKELRVETDGLEYSPEQIAARRIEFQQRIRNYKGRVNVTRRGEE